MVKKSKPIHFPFNYIKTLKTFFFIFFLANVKGSLQRKLIKSLFAKILFEVLLVLVSSVSVNPRLLEVRLEGHSISLLLTDTNHNFSLFHPTLR